MDQLPALTIATVRAALQQPLPGRAAQISMAVQPRPGDRPDLPRSCPHEAAVLLLLYQRPDEWVLPLTRRSETVQSHRGQVSLPGGAREPQDSTLAHTAVRETCEELGVSERNVQVIGALSPLYIPVSGFCVHPHVAYIDGVPLFRLRTEEVAEVLEAPLRQLLDPATRRVTARVRDGQHYHVPFYQLGNHEVWGATAMILGEFVALLRQALGTPLPLR
jgi:8-oxo-dGTP pyrophosphatase MutT (NUDIX family)